MSCIQVKVSLFKKKKIVLFVKIYASTMIFNSFYEINLSLVNIIHQFLYIIHQISLNLICIKNFI